MIHFIGDFNMDATPTHASAEGIRLSKQAQQELMEIGNVVVDEVVDGYRLLCTGGGNGPTILLDPEWWIGPGSWSVIQAELSSDALVCSHGAVKKQRDLVA